MISQLLGEMEREGIDELDYPRFESVVCKTLGDMALARSRARVAVDEVRTRVFGALLLDHPAINPPGLV